MTENPFKSPRAEERWPKRWDSIHTADLAKIIFETLQECHLPEHEYRVVDAQDFRHLSRRFYRRSQAKFEALGFAFLGDVEDVTLKSGSIDPRTFFRTMVDPLGTTVAIFYHIKPEALARLWMFLSRTPSKILDIESYTSDGYSFCTTTAPALIEVPQPASIRHDYASRRLGLAELYRQHLHSLSTHGMSQRLRCIRNVEHVIEMQNVQNRQKHEHLEKIGWSTPDYLRSQGVPEDKLDDVRDEIKKLRDTQKKSGADHSGPMIEQP